MSPDLLPIEDAQAIVTDVAADRLGIETVPIGTALDRVLAADVRAGADIPGFAASAMDGFAIRDLEAGARLILVGESRAGRPFPGSLSPGQAVRISTGAVVPRDAAAVVRQEDVSVSDGTIEIGVASAAGDNVRRPGEDMHSGEVILEAGVRIGPAELGAAVAAGAGELDVAVRPAVTVLSTGDELRAPGEPLGPGEIHNSNRPMLAALVTRCGGVPAPAAVRDGVLPDDLPATRRALEAALEVSDVVIVSGGVSVGPHDHVKPALGELGVTEHFWGVALQPGKPTWFGSLGRKLVFALPGNPVSAVVTFSLFTRPALDALLGARPLTAPVPEARLAGPVRRNPVRDQALRVRLEQQDGVAVVTPTGAQGSHLLTSILRADCLAIIPRGEGQLQAGTPVRLQALPV
jgi:molybdopterin molybdotransferase